MTVSPSPTTQPFSVPDRLARKGNENKSKVAVFQTEWDQIKWGGTERVLSVSPAQPLADDKSTFNTFEWKLLFYFRVCKLSRPPSKVLYNFPIKPSFPGWEWMFNTLQLSALVGVTPDKDSLVSPRHQITPCLTLSLALFSFSDEMPDIS